MLDWLSHLHQGFMPHGHCYLWSPGLLWLQVITNFAIGAAYVTIALTLARLVHVVRDIPFKMMYLAFGVFIVTCGLTHFSDVWVIWYPHYWADGVIRAVTAVASVATAVLLPPLLPQAEGIARGAKAAHDRGVKLESLVSDLEQLYARARELDELKTQFFANVSHELRTPLTLILGPTERLAARDDLTPGVHEELALIRRNARALLGHVNELLEVAKLDAGAVQLRWAAVDLADLVRTTAANFDSLARERDTVFRVEANGALPAEVDAGRMRRVILNLLSNAFKFTPEGGTVRLTLRSNGEEAVLDVADSGPGIPEELREAAFERFRQLEGGAARRFGGTGLGLPIVRDFVGLHGGTVSIEDAPEGGALFRVVIPTSAPEGAEVGASAPELEVEPMPLSEARPFQEAALRPADAPRALVVEDTPEMRAFVHRVLSGEYDVELAADGAEGLERAFAAPPDIIVTDLMMPGTSGDQLIREVRARQDLSTVPILVLTARVDDPLRIEMLRLGAQDWLSKPSCRRSSSCVYDTWCARSE